MKNGTTTTYEYNGNDVVTRVLRDVRLWRNGCGSDDLCLHQEAEEEAEKKEGEETQLVVFVGGDGERDEDDNNDNNDNNNRERTKSQDFQ